VLYWLEAWFLEGLQLVQVGDGHPDHAESFYEELLAAIADGATGPLVVHLSQIPFVTPGTLIRLITAARLWHRLTGNPVILDGMRPNVHQYLERMDLFSSCNDCIRPARHLGVADRWSRSRASDNLLEVMPVSAEAAQNSLDVTAALARAQRILRTWFGADQEAIGPIATMLAETASNVTHSRDRGFAVIQHHRRQTGDRVTIAVGDLGIGIEDSLGRQGARLRLGSGEPPPTGADAILRALELGVTARGDVGGVGLHLVKTIVEQWRGILAIRSKQSSVRIAAGEVHVMNGLVEVPGTQVVVTVRR
jgi:hypothetical protein